MKEYATRIVSLYRFIGDANVYKLDAEMNKMAEKGWVYESMTQIDKEGEDFRFPLVFSREKNEPKKG